MSFEQRMEHRLEKQLTLAEESNRILVCIAKALEDIAKAKTIETWQIKS